MRDFPIGKDDPICKCGHYKTSHTPNDFCLACHCAQFRFNDTRIGEPGKKEDWLAFTWRAAKLVLEVIEFGNQKHKDNPRAKYDRQHWLRKALRHLVAFAGGEENDPESGKSHLAHAIADLLYALEA